MNLFLPLQHCISPHFRNLILLRELSPESLTSLFPRVGLLITPRSIRASRTASLRMLTTRLIQESRVIKETLNAGGGLASHAFTHPRDQHLFNDQPPPSVMVIALPSLGLSDSAGGGLL